MAGKDAEPEKTLSPAPRPISVTPALITHAKETTVRIPLTWWSWWKQTKVVTDAATGACVLRMVKPNIADARGRRGMSRFLITCTGLS
jgi:hypothetical protein